MPDFKTIEKLYEIKYRAKWTLESLSGANVHFDRGLTEVIRLCDESIVMAQEALVERVKYLQRQGDTFR